MLWLACTDGADKGQAIKLGDKPVLLGRQIDCDLQLKDKCASRHHCRVTLDDRRMTVEDLGSSNGIKFNGKRYRGDSFKLWPGQGFCIGDDEFAYTDELKEEQQEVIDLTEVGGKPPTNSMDNGAGDSRNLLSEADRAELAEAAKKAKRKKMREVATKTVWDRIKSMVGKGD